MKLNRKISSLVIGAAAMLTSGSAFALECSAVSYASAPAVEADSPVLKCDYAVGRRYSKDTRGSGVAYRDIDVVEALPACKEAVALYPDNPRLQFQLARVYYKAESVRETAKLMRKASDANYPPAIAYLGYLYSRGEGVPEDQAKAQSLYEEAACAGDAWAMYYIGNRYRNSTHVEEDMGKAVEWLTKAADAGVDDAQYVLGNMLIRGQGVDRDVNRGMDLMRKSAEQGSQYALATYGWFHGAGYFGIRQDKAEANKWYEAAATKGNDSAKGNLGQNYRWGRGAPKDPARAAFWSRHAAYHGTGWGLYKAADLYQYGVGVDKNADRAKDLYLKAAAKFQEGVDDDSANDAHWLGTLYEKGLGVEKSREKAIELYKQAAADDYQHSIKKLKKLGVPLENE